MPDFIEEGLRRLKYTNPASSVELRTEDLVKTLERPDRYDLVLYAYESDVLGSMSESINRVGKIAVPSGYIMFEAAYKSGEYAGEEYPSEEEMYQEIDKSGGKVVDSVKWERDFLYAFNEKALKTMKQRIGELKTFRPDPGDVFDQYYKNQQLETEILDKYIECMTFLLKL
jgi:hypothetical protein